MQHATSCCHAGFMATTTRFERRLHCRLSAGSFEAVGWFLSQGLAQCTAVHTRLQWALQAETAPCHRMSLVVAAADSHKSSATPSVTATQT